MVELPLDFIERMKTVDGFLKSYETEVQRAVRVNTLKIAPEKFKEISPVALDGAVPWADNGFYTSGESLGKTVEHFAGLYYVQEPSAMSPAPKLNAKAGERVLDLCSAPGGKGTQLAEQMAGHGVLVLNEIDPQRCEILRSNVERLGITNATVTNAPPDLLEKPFESFFDKILIDAPCSGEGMFKKEKNAVEEWSVQNVKMCAERQKKILESADKMLSAGGKMVYSTCTFAPEEDEEQIQNFLNTHDYTLCEIEKLLPHKVRGEGHFYAVLQKNYGERRDLPYFKLKHDKRAYEVYREWEKCSLNITLERLHFTENGTVYRIEENTPDLSALKKIPFRTGVCLGKLSADKKRFEPSHSLAMALKAEQAHCIEVDRPTAVNYMKGLTFECSDSIKGWNLVTYGGYPLGWCKAVNGTAKNHLPKGLRI